MFVGQKVKIAVYSPRENRLLEEVVTITKYVKRIGLNNLVTFKTSNGVKTVTSQVLKSRMI